jgi:hypothetical protein
MTDFRDSACRVTSSNPLHFRDSGIIGRTGSYVISSLLSYISIHLRHGPISQDFQTFAFQLLVRNDVRGLTFQCPTVNGSCLCPFESSLTPAECALTGEDIVRVRSILLVFNLASILIVFAESWVSRGARWALCGNFVDHHYFLSCYDLGRTYQSEEIIIPDGRIFWIVSSIPLFYLSTIQQ